MPFGVDALISLAIAKVAAVGTKEPRYVSFYRRLVREGYVRLSRGVRLILLGRKRVNAHMAYLAIYPLLALETDPELLVELQKTERLMWRVVANEQNGLFSFVHASVGDWMDALRTREGRARTRSAGGATRSGCSPTRRSRGPWT